jgi:uncharacterized protein
VAAEVGRMRFVAWSGSEPWRAEAALVDLRADGLGATGVQLGAHPVPYRLDYRLDALEGFITRELDLAAVGEEWKRRLLLRHDGSGRWAAERAEGHSTPGPLAPEALPDLSPARDCDITDSPLTNTMPILRGRLDREGAAEFLMAFIVVPELRVLASHQGYEHLRRTDDGAVVRYRGLDSGFSADLELDAEGLVEAYPGLAVRQRR